MKLLERILVYTDFGVGADAAVRMASYTARQFDSEVDLLCVNIPGREAAMLSSDGYQVLSQRVDELAGQMVEQGVRSVKPVVLDGVQFEQIEQYALQRDVNLIIVGAAETSSSRQSLLGATATWLRLRASRPVWIVKPGTAPPIRRILCPVDLRPSSARALRSAIHFARQFGAELTVLTVTQWPLSYYDDLPDTLETAGEDSKPRGAYLPEFDEFLRGFDFHQVRFEKVIRRGKAGYEVAQVAREMPADLLVVGATGRKGLSHLLLGGVARRLGASCPVR